ncbi:YolD-like family protein [Sporosarcina sp. 179-K 3D1 HS]|uniref:YolD-like family protein n=1 Tax=Sporosarcina sp. 179-K 3D1 HS TaxID=3232169 RepID=UPI0039A37B27
MIRDRGRIKWTAMMLPEHVQQLRDWHEEEHLPQRREPDEQHYEEWNRLMAKAAEEGSPLAVTFWKAGTSCTVEGVIAHIDSSSSLLRLSSVKGESCLIPIGAIEHISDIG